MQELGQLAVESADPQAVLVEQLLGRDIELADVVFAVIEEVADFFERHRLLR